MVVASGVATISFPFSGGEIKQSKEQAGEHLLAILFPSRGFCSLQNWRNFLHIFGEQSRNTQKKIMPVLHASFYENACYAQ